MARRADTGRLQGDRRIWQALAYVYDRETREQADIAKVLTFDEARRVAVNVAKLPELLGGEARDRQHRYHIHYRNCEDAQFRSRDSGPRRHPSGSTIGLGCCIRWDLGIDCRSQNDSGTQTETCSHRKGSHSGESLSPHYPDEPLSCCSPWPIQI